MPITRPIVRSIARAITNSIPGDNVVQRFFTDLSSVLTQHYTIPAWTATGDFTCTSLIYFDGSGDLVVQGNSFNTNNRLLISGSGEASLRCGSGTTIFSGLGKVAPNTLHMIESGRVGSTGFVKLNGVQIASGNVGTATTTVNAVNQNGNNYGSGIIADLSLTEAGGDNRSYAIDEDLSTTSTIVDSVGGQDGTAVNIVSSDLYQFDGTVSPNTWANQNPPFNVIDVAGT